MKLLRELHRDGAAWSPDPDERRRYAHLVHVLIGAEEALPLYDAIAADFPDSKRSAFIAAMVRLERDDPAGLEPAERLAAERPHLGVPIYREMILFHQRAGNGEESARLLPLFQQAIRADDLAMHRQQYRNPGGPPEPLPLDEEDRAFARYWLTGWLGGIPEVTGLLGASRRLDDGTRENLFWMDVEPEADEESVMERVVELVSIWGDFELWAPRPEREWIRDELASVEGSRLFP